MLLLVGWPIYKMIMFDTPEYSTLLPLLHYYDVLSLCRSFVTAELVSL